MAATSRAQRRYGNPPKKPSKALKNAAAAGRGGDSMLAHIGPEEAAALKAMGGAGTVNPDTGLLEFTSTDVGADPGAKGAGTAAGGGNTSVGADPGAKGGGTGVAGSTTGGNAGGTRSDGTALPGTPTSPGGTSGLLGGGTTAATSKSTTEGTATGALRDPSTAAQPKLNALPPGVSGTTPTPNLDALAAAPTGLTSGKYVQAAANMGTAYADYKNYNTTMMEDVGNFLASMAGFNEINPTKQPISHFVGQDQADWGFDPAGLIGSAVGSAAGLPFGGGLTADLISRALGRPLEINLGPDVGALAGVGSGEASRADRRYGGKQA